MYDKSFVGLLIGVAAGLVFFGGCATGSSATADFGRAGADGSSLAAASRDESSPGETSQGEDSKRLAAIEDFLARTSEYQLTDGVESAEARSAFDGGRNDFTSFARDDHEGAERDRRPGNEVSQSGTSRTREKNRDDVRNASVTANAHMSLPGSTPTGPRPALPTLLSVSVVTDPSRTSARPAKPDIEPARVTNAAIDVRRATSAFSFDDWLNDLEEQADHGRNLVAEWKLRFVELAMGRDVTAQDLGSSLSSETRTLLAALFETVRAVREVAANPLSMGDQALARVDALKATLSDRADPVITTVALCTRVVTFGVYDQMELDALVAGRELQTIVYSEIENLKAGLTDGARYETRLATRLELFSAAGVSVWLKEEPEIVDVCRRRRNDFFIAQRITIPPTIPAGDYVLKVSIEDRNAHLAAENTLPITIRSPVSVASGR